MDVLVIHCPSCENELRLPDLSLLGRFGRCPACKHKFVLEDPDDRLADTGEFLLPDDVEAITDEHDQPGADETVPMASGSFSDSVAEGEHRQYDVPQKIGRYQIVKELGQGSMGAVYLAFDNQLQREVALKVPKFSAADGPKPIERFYREARLAATLSHPSICPVYDIGEVDGTRYIAMAYIDGRPLTDYIRRRNPQPLRHIAKTICRIALAVQEAHDRGVIHRDLKPDNIMIDKNRKPVIMDFGLARKLFEQGDEKLTHSGALVGSPAYMSPEQVEGNPEQITAASDIYTLGVILYELLTGLRPYQGSVGAVMGQILRDNPQPPTELRPEIDSRLESICLRMMAKRPEDRFASMDAVAYALAEYVRASDQVLEAPPPTVELPVFNPETLAELNDGQRKDIEEQKQRAERLLIERRNDEAVSVLQSITAFDSARFLETADWAREQLEKLADKRKTSPAEHLDRPICRVARKLIDDHDYEHAVQMLRQIPKADRDEEVNRLLNECVGLRAQVKTLMADINRARRNRDFFDMDRKLRRLLELKPDHRRARQLIKDLQQEGYSGGSDLSADRRVAEWVLRAGGAVDLLVSGDTKQGIESVRDLPAEDFQVISIGRFSRNAVNDAELQCISGLTSLENLTLTQQTGITDEGLQHLQNCTGLTSLHLGFTGLRGSGLKYLSGMSSLVKLDLANTKIGDGGLASLRSLGSLQFLGLFGTQVTDAGVEDLALLKSLTFLDVYDTQVSDDGAARLAVALPGCRINH